jgi:glycosyltransferase involved in cell wall biosynthesis
MTRGVRSVDVVLPTHRGRLWVGEAIESVLAQTHGDLTLSVVDDASGDGTVDFVQQRWADVDSRVRVIGLEPPPRHAAAARLVGLRGGTGAFVAFIDQDDHWLPEKLDRQLARFASGPGVDAVHTDVTHIDEHGHELRGAARGENQARARIDWDELADEALARRLFLGLPIRLVSALVRRSAFEAVGGFDVSLFGGEDWEFWVRFAAAGHRIAHLPEPLVERRVHPAQASSARADERLAGHLAALERVVARHPALADLARERHAALLRRNAWACVRAGRGAEARVRLRELAELGPRTRSERLLWLASFGGPLAARLLDRPKSR